MSADAGAAWMRALLGIWWPPVPPTLLSQPVLPDWNFGTVLNVNSANSAAPEVETAILRKRSYGRQLGKISDALQVLIDERDDVRPGPAAEKALTDFSAMKRDNDHTKAELLEARVHRLRNDLTELEERDASTYRRLRRLLDDLP